jgi:ribosomal protein L37AE/L43A
MNCPRCGCEMCQATNKRAWICAGCRITVRGQPDACQVKLGSFLDNKK